MGKRILKDDRYSGLPEDGRQWPEVLIGANEIGGYLRRHPSTVAKMMRQGCLPATRDGRKRWMTTRRLLDVWILEGVRLDLERRTQRHKE